MAFIIKKRNIGNWIEWNLCFNETEAKNYIQNKSIPVTPWPTSALNTHSNAKQKPTDDQSSEVSGNKDSFLKTYWKDINTTPSISYYILSILYINIKGRLIWAGSTENKITISWTANGGSWAKQ